MTSVRRPAVAGSFYPGDPQILAAQVEELLDDAGSLRRDGSPKAVIVPHAGYIYSGPVAARAYAEIRSLKGRVRRVVLLGPAHCVPLQGLAAPAVQAFDTPLGRLEVDLEARCRIADLPQVAIDDRPHLSEHALEVQLPFILAALGPVGILPLVVGRCTAGQVAEVLRRLWGGPETLIVISSDLSHYLAYDAARQRDGATAAAIENLDGAALGPEDACGYLPVAGLLAVVERSGLEIVRLDLRNSGDTAGLRDRVVGYGAWAFYEPGGAGREPVMAKS